MPVTALPNAGSRLLVASGARATEALLLASVAPLLAAARSDWRLLAKPVRIVVPSRTLRDHVSALLVRHVGGAVAGVQVQTLRGLAREILERADVQRGPGAALLPILVRGAARQEAVFAAELGDLQDGFGAVVGSVRDLLDAGFTPDHADAAEDLLAELAVPAPERARGLALLRVAASAEREREALGIDSRASGFRRACDVLRAAPETALPQRAVFVHGFADATGLATDLLEAVARCCGATVLVDRPVDPADRDKSDRGAAFTRRFSERLAALSDGEVVSGAPEDPPAIALLEAPGVDAELRGVAARVRALLDEGVAPESIGIVARTLVPYAARLGVHLERLGIPFSAAPAHAGFDATGRFLEALFALLDRRLEMPADRWIDMLLAADGRTPPGDLRVALHALGAARLRDVASLDLAARLAEATSFGLPIRHGFDATEDEAGVVSLRASRRRVPRDGLERVVAAAIRTVDVLRVWPESAPIGLHGASLRALVTAALGAAVADPATGAVLDAAATLARETPGSFALTREDFLRLLRDACAGLGVSPLGGAGGGVRVLDATLARGVTFAHLFVLGMNRDVFPRIVLEDPLFPDALRGALAAVLPDLPRKLGGFDEERYLFAQLLSASPRITLSRQCIDDTGRERAPSTFVDRLRLVGAVPAAERLPTLWSAAASAAPRPAGEHAVLAGLHGSRAALTKILPLALREAVGLDPTLASDIQAVAASRLATLALLEPQGALRGAVGPLLGFVGERREGDPRGASLAITTLEGLAKCPWQTFLTRVLHVEPTPDALESLPAVDARLLGMVLHGTIEAIVKAVIPGERESLVDVRARGAVPVPWPGDMEVRRLLDTVAAQTLREAGLFFPGLARVVATRTVPLVQAVFKGIWQVAGGAPELYGAEVVGAFRVRDGDDRLRDISFRADLVEDAGGVTRLIDLKSGKPIADVKKPESRGKHLLAAVAGGKSLQAAAYAQAAEGEGRYFFADPTRNGELPSWTVAHDEGPITEAFERTVQTLLAAWDRGSFVPRLEPPDETDWESPCRHCQVSDACVRGDSGARGRLHRFASDGAGTGAPADGALTAARAVLALGVKGAAEATEAQA